MRGQHIFPGSSFPLLRDSNGPTGKCFDRNMGAYAASDCKGTVKFLQWQELYERERPFWVLMDVPKDAVDQRTTNLVFEDVEQDFRDVRGREHQFSLDQHGFMYLRRQIDFEAFNNQEAVTSNYLPQLERLLQDHVDGVDKVFFFDWRVSNYEAGIRGLVNTIW